MIRPYLFPLPLLAMAEAYAQAPQAPAAADLGGSMWQMFFGLALVLALMVGSLWILKKLVAPRGENAGLLRVVAGTAVGARERVVIVEVGSTWLVLGVAPGRVSALAEVPIRQSIAVTGSVNQFGAVQPIGGVNEKIEGFFDICNGRGLTGEQGVLIPASNVVHLMLRKDVVAAAEAGKFHIYAVSSIDEGISILTAKPAGVRGAGGVFPPESINGRVEAKLISFAMARQAFGQHDGDEDSKARKKS